LLRTGKTYTNVYQVKAYFKDKTIIKYFIDQYDAIDFRDTVDAHYPLKVTFEKGVYPVSTFIINCWNVVMDHRFNPLKNIPDLQVRHLVLQILAWMWCIIFSMWIGSYFVMGISMVAHVLLLAGIVVTVGTFEVSRTNPSFFLRNDGYHSTSRTRQHMWINGKKVKLDPNDPGGEHE